MLEQSWAEGYVVDVAYTHGFYADLAPSALRFAALLGSVQPLDADRAFTYYELGCGQGRTTAVLAAANPHGQFIGVDFNPTHIHNAQRLAHEGGLQNLRFLEKSFAELAGLELPDAEVVALHGVWSWVSAENRAHIVEFIRRRLKPGGSVLVSYNALPGLAPVVPLQRLLYEHARAGGGELMQRVGRALEFATALERAGAFYFLANPMAKVRLGQLGEQDRRYVAHEYHNSEWTPFFHADVVRELAAAKLTYTASAVVRDNFDQFVLKPEAAKLAGQASDRVMAEMIKDFARNQAFRKDLFNRGAPKATPQELESLLDGLRFALGRARRACTLKLATSAGEIALHEDIHLPVLDALARQPMTFEELLGAPECSKLDRVRLRQAVFALVAAENVSPALAAAGESARAEHARRFNAATLARAPTGPEHTVLASPVLGSGVAISLLHRVFLTAGEAGAVEHAAAAVTSGKVALTKEGKPVTGEADIRELIGRRADIFFREVLPYYRMLKVAE